MEKNEEIVVSLKNEGQIIATKEFSMSITLIVALKGFYELEEISSDIKKRIEKVFNGKQGSFLYIEKDGLNVSPLEHLVERAMLNKEGKKEVVILF